ncbi:hypothetical protein [Vibrio ostreicida]|uniref:hypothetical protein n=1 Tax=Vibrio ostreicida TaxID=526588 RepID=UPI00387ED5AB
MASAQVRTGHHCSRLVYTAIGRAVASLKKAQCIDTGSMGDVLVVRRRRFKV